MTEDPVEAQAWLILAGEGGYETAQKIRDLVGKEMTKEQIVRATKRAKEIMATIKK